MDYLLYINRRVCIELFRMKTVPDWLVDGMGTPCLIWLEFRGTGRSRCLEKKFRRPRLFPHLLHLLPLCSLLPALYGLRPCALALLRYAVCFEDRLRSCLIFFSSSIASSSVHDCEEHEQQGQRFVDPTFFFFSYEEEVCLYVFGL